MSRYCRGMANATVQETPARILVVEDDQGVRESLAVVLQVQSYEVRGVDHGELALESHRDFDPELVILDLNLPGIDGLETCRRLRAAGFRGPILMLTARHEVSDRVAGLDAGADDYLPKPFALDELLARVRALLRSFDLDNGADQSDSLTLDDLVIDIGPRRVTRAGREIEMTRIEFELLTYLVMHADRVLDRNDIQMHVWGYEEDLGSNSLEVFVSALRKKLEVGGASRLIHTKRGVGYVARLGR